MKEYGPRGWWPIYSLSRGKSLYRGKRPRNSRERFEVCAGAVLTQSVAWTNVEKALHNLKAADLLTAESVLTSPHEKIAPLVRPAGYFNQKTKKLKALAAWFLERGVKTSCMKKLTLDEFRHELLAIKGVGPETADSILLYAWGRKTFVVDAYTKRIFSRLGIIDGTEDYETVRALFHKSFRGEVKEYQEYHGLIVEHAKARCRTKPDCAGCPFGEVCGYPGSTINS